jgi:hypothetical protein
VDWEAGRISVFWLFLASLVNVPSIQRSNDQEIMANHKTTESHKTSTSSIIPYVFLCAPYPPTYTAPMSIPIEPANSGAQITSRHGPFLPQTSNRNAARSQIQPPSNLIESSFSIKLPLPFSQGSSNLVRCASSLLGPRYTSTRSHFEDAAIRVAASLALQGDKGIVLRCTYRRYRYLLDGYVYIRRFALSRSCAVFFFLPDYFFSLSCYADSIC